MNTINLKKTLSALVIAGGLTTLGLAGKTLYEMHKHETTSAIEEKKAINNNVRTYADLSIGSMAATLMTGLMGYGVKKTYPNGPRKITPSLSDVMSSQNYLGN